MSWSTPVTYTVGQTLTASNLNTYVRDNSTWDHNLGTLSYVEITANSAAVGASETTILTAASVTVVSGRRIRISFGCQGVQGTVTGDLFDFNVKEGATFLNSRQFRVSGGNDGGAVEAVILPAGGAHVYTITLSRTVGTGTGTVLAAATFPAFIHVTDVGV